MRASFDRHCSRAGLLFIALALVFCAFAPQASAAGPPAKTRTCEKIVLSGEVSAGQSWRADFGEGWVFRVLPIPTEKTAPGVGGWDLVVDRKAPAGYPDALLVATPPYHFINPREVGTTFGLRAQDAIGWNPRHFHFMTNRRAFRQAQKLYLELNHKGAFGRTPRVEKSARSEKQTRHEMQRFVKLAREASDGEFRIVDARLVPGTGKVKPYATHWARESANTPHTFVAGPPTPLGKLLSIRFSVTLWLPKGWRTPRKVEKVEVPCTP